TAMDACAPAPSCGGGTNGSDLWFSFYASNTTAIINVVQNTSYVAAIQAFAGGTDCALLTEIGCGIAGGPSSGAQLSLSGLTIGELYYYRVYGSSNNNSQRTGNYCFCGSAGMSGIPLAPAIYLNAAAEDESALLHWTVADGANVDHYDIERGADAYSFATVSTVEADQQAETQDYQFLDRFLPDGSNFYRLKAVDANGVATYSNIAEVQIEHTSTFLIAGNPTLDVLHVQAQEPFVGNILNMHGATLLQQPISIGENQMDVAMLPSGAYYLKNTHDGAVCRFFIQR
ncbi:MAG TPA: hypothetical protein VHS96_18740, partial [Bacteroidia bacterium]|nr:hypothetical protein [Bacteroidia bacterium]